MKDARSKVTFVLVVLWMASSLWGQTSGERTALTADRTNTAMTTGQLEWTRIPGSAMDSVFIPGVDDDFAGAENSWEKIQVAWSGGACIDNELYLWGGGHGNGAHNGILAVDVRTGKWRRVTEPSPVWSEATCPKGVCRTEAGKCKLGKCNVGPDGRPVARHTYYMLTTDGRALYSVGGSIYGSGTSGIGPTTFKFALSNRKWEALPQNSPIPRPHGSAVQIGSKVYQMTGRGFAVLETATGSWKRSGKLSGRGGGTGLVYAPTTDRIYAFGDGEASFVGRSKWGKAMTAIPTAPSLVSQKGIGMTYVPGPDLILLWNGGPKMVTLDPKTNRWGELVLGGDPGPALENGTFGRFSFCGGRVVLVNGVDRDLYYAELPGTIEPEPPSEPTDPPPSDSDDDPTYEDRPDDQDPAPDYPSMPPPPTTATPAPHYGQPPGDALVRAQCGPESDWEVIDVHTTSDAENLKQLISADTRAVIRVHWRPEPYPTIRVKGGRCIKVVGILGPSGERPLVASVNGTKQFRDEVRPGGLIIENLVVSAGKAESLAPGFGEKVADCVGVPNDRMFFIIRDTEVSQCGHHSFVADHAHHLYVEIGRSYFAQAGSHLAYINHVAMAYIYDSAFESPGWGHALRCIALRCRIERTKVSNVQLDGSVLPTGTNPLTPKRVYIGMQPLEVYTCGENEVRDVEAVFWSDRKYNGSFAATVRNREAFRTCDVGEVIDGQWTRLMWGDPDFFDRRRWSTVTPLVTKIERMRVTCVGPLPCDGWDIKGNYPVMDDPQKSELQKWLKAAQFATWDDMLRAIPETRPEWRWVASVTLPGHRSSFLKGTITNKVPLPVPLTGWVQRTEVHLRDVLVDRGDLLRPESDPTTYCYGTPPVADSAGNLLDRCSDQFDGKHYRRAYVQIE